MAASLVSQVIASTLNSFMVGLAAAVEHGYAATTDQVRSALTSAAQDNCSDDPAGCPGGQIPQDQIDSAVATYAAALNSQVQTTASLFDSGSIANPVGLTPQQVAQSVGLYYSPSSGPAAPSNVIPPEQSPTSPAFTSAANISATSQNSSVAGAAAGVGPGVGGSTTIQSPLTPASDAGAAVQALGSNNNMMLYLILAGALILVLLLRKG